MNRVFGPVEPTRHRNRLSILRMSILIGNRWIDFATITQQHLLCVTNSQTGQPIVKLDQCTNRHLSVDEPIQNADEVSFEPFSIVKVLRFWTHPFSKPSLSCCAYCGSLIWFHPQPLTRRRRQQPRPIIVVEFRQALNQFSWLQLAQRKRVIGP